MELYDDAAVDLIEAVIYAGCLSLGALVRTTWLRRAFIRRMTLLGLVLGALYGVLASRYVESVASLRSSIASRYVDMQIPEVFTLTSEDVLRRFRREMTSHELLSGAVSEVKLQPIGPYVDLFRSRIEIDHLKLRFDDILKPTPDRASYLDVTVRAPHPVIGEAILASLIKRATARTEEVLRAEVKSKVEFEKRRSTYLVNTNRPRAEGAVAAQILKLSDEAAKDPLAINTQLREIGKELFVDEYTKHVQRLKFLEEIDVDKIKFGLIDIDRAPSTPLYSEIRNLIAPLLQGLALGAFVALFWVFFQFVRQQVWQGKPE